MRGRGRKALDGLKDDLRDHLARQIEENIARGMVPEEARRQAFLALGNPTLIEEDTRAVWVWRWLDDLRQDVRYALRTFRRGWMFSLVALITLTLGIGAATGIFSVVYAVALRPLPYGDAGKLVQVFSKGNLTRAQYEALVGQSKTLDGVAAARIEDSTTPTANGDVRVFDFTCTLNLFDVLRVRPEVGRTFAATDANQRVAILDHEWWIRQFGGNPAVVGRSLVLDDVPYQVIGVMPASFRFPYQHPADAWIPADAQALAQSEQNGVWATVARLRPSTSISAARAELSVLAARLAASDPGRYGHASLTPTPLIEAVIGAPVQSRLDVLLTAVGFVLLIACVNVASLLLTWSESRARELAVRAALGASRVRLVRQLLTETILMGLIGGVGGVFLASWTLGVVVGLLPSSVPRMESVAIDETVLLVALALSLLSGIACGLMPAVKMARRELQERLKDSGAVAIPGTARASGVFVFMETALAVVLLIGAALVIRSFDLLNRVDPGFDASHLIAIAVVGHPSPAQMLDLIDRARSLPGVRHASGASFIPFLGGMGHTDGVEVQGRPVPPPDPANMVNLGEVLPGYFHMLGVRMVRGREFTAQDVHGAPFVAVINQAAVRRYFPREDPIGLRIGNGVGWYQIVGIAADTKLDSLAEDTTPTMYFPALQAPEWTNREFAIVTRMDPATRLTPQNLKAEATAALGGAGAIRDVQSMDALIARSLQQSKFQAVLLGIFGGLALVLAVVGIFGVTSYAVVQRTREIGVRLALGGQRSDMLTLIVTSTSRPVIYGLLVGLFGAVLATRSLAAFLFRITPTDVPTYAVTATLFLGVALLASMIPAYRATRVDPVVTLRQN